MRDIVFLGGIRIRNDAISVTAENDGFICPNGDVLVRNGEDMANGKLQYSYFGANCSECPFQVECAGKDKRRKITSDDYEAEGTQADGR